MQILTFVLIYQLNLLEISCQNGAILCTNSKIQHAVLLCKHWKVLEYKNTLYTENSYTSLVAKIIVASWDLSPHSAKNVNVNDCRKIGETKPKHRLGGFVTLIIPDSGSSTTDVLDISCSYKEKYFCDNHDHLDHAEQSKTKQDKQDDVHSQVFQ